MTQPSPAYAQSVENQDEPALDVLFDQLDEIASSLDTSARTQNGASPSNLSYRAAPDNSLIMGSHLISGQVVLILQKTGARWEIALPPKIAAFAPSDHAPSMAAAKQIAEAAFSAWAAEAKPGMA